ncbi:MAG TPA: helix-turn-helix transcriptional regulator [Longimicrobiaceae bacterium]|nr:helix-turn-helix transcriptional regulator [Longimicrobiaceae bacterium]
MSDDLTVHDSSGNVFEDMGMPEVSLRLAKAELARAIRNVLRERDLTQTEAARILGVTQPDVSNLLRGKLARFSEKKLEDFLLRLGMDVTVRITPSRSEHGRRLVEIG